MVTVTDEPAVAKRRLILRDSLAILSLVSMTAILFAVTLFLFRSFTSHRNDLAIRWSSRGAQAMKDGKPEQAIVALRTALSYAPETRQYELMLAQALGEAGHTDESYNYFMGLWAAEPGNGFINLELARLAAKRGNTPADRQSAINFYRAAIYGTWEGDGVARRAEVRLELARYLIAAHELAPARMELLIAGGNTIDDPDFDLTLGHLLEQAEDTSDAAGYYRKALTARPNDLSSLEAAGSLAYRSGDYETANRLLTRAQTERADNHTKPPSADDTTMMNNAQRILALMPAKTLSNRERVARILADRLIAKKRFDTCSTSSSSPSSSSSISPAALHSLAARWAGSEGVADAAALLRDPEQQDSTLQLIYDTESQTSLLCGAPTGDDALLLLLANSAGTSSGDEKGQQ